MVVPSAIRLSHDSIRDSAEVYFIVNENDHLHTIFSPILLSTSFLYETQKPKNLSQMCILYIRTLIQHHSHYPRSFKCSAFVMPTPKALAASQSPIPPLQKPDVFLSAPNMSPRSFDLKLPCSYPISSQLQIQHDQALPSKHPFSRTDIFCRDGLTW